MTAAFDLAVRRVEQRVERGLRAHLFLQRVGAGDEGRLLLEAEQQS